MTSAPVPPGAGAGFLRTLVNEFAPSSSHLFYQPGDTVDKLCYRGPTVLLLTVVTILLTNTLTNKVNLQVFFGRVSSNDNNRGCSRLSRFYSLFFTLYSLLFSLSTHIVEFQLSQEEVSKVSV